MSIIIFDIIATFSTANDITMPATPIISKATPEPSYPIRYIPSPMNATAAEMKNAI
mgnify:CR=1 FL=1